MEDGETPEEASPAGATAAASPAADPPADTVPHPGRLRFNSRPYCVRWSVDGSVLAVGDDDSSISVLETSEAGGALRVAQQFSGALAGSADALPTLALCWRPTGRAPVLLEANCSGWLNHWHVPSRRRLHATRHPEAGALHAVDYACDGERFATAGKDATVRVYEEATKSEMLALRGGLDRSLAQAHVQQIFSVRFHDSERQLLVSGGWDRLVHLWDLRAGASVGRFSGPFVAGSDALDVRGHVLAAGSNGHGAQCLLFDLRRPGAQPTVQLDVGPHGVRAHQAPYTVYACRLSREPGHAHVAIGGGVPGAAGDGAVHLVERASGRLVRTVAELRGQTVYSIDFAPLAAGAARLAYAAGSKEESFVQVVDEEGQEAAARAAA